MGFIIAAGLFTVAVLGAVCIRSAQMLLFPASTGLEVVDPAPWSPAVTRSPAYFAAAVPFAVIAPVVGDGLASWLIAPLLCGLIAVMWVRRGSVQGEGRYVRSLGPFALDDDTRRGIWVMLGLQVPATLLCVALGVLSIPGR